MDERDRIRHDRGPADEEIGVGVTDAPFFRPGERMTADEHAPGGSLPSRSSTIRFGAADVGEDGPGLGEGRVTQNGLGDQIDRHADDDEMEPGIAVFGSRWTSSIAPSALAPSRDSDGPAAHAVGDAAHPWPRARWSRRSARRRRW